MTNSLIVFGVLAFLIWTLMAGRARRARKPAKRSAPKATKVAAKGKPAGTPHEHKVFFSSAHRSPFDALARLRDGDIDGARRAMQKISYMVHKEQQTNPAVKAQFTELMKKFAAIDPLFWRCLELITPVVHQTPGVKQTALYPHMPVDTETARYVLYFAHELGHLRRVKKGNSYLVYLPQNAALASPSSSEPKH